MSEQPSEPWVPPEWRDQLNRDSEMLEAMGPRVRRKAFLQGFVTGIWCCVILAVLAWTLSP